MMMEWLSFVRRYAALWMAMLTWLVMQGAVWAQTPGLPQQEKKGESYVVSYMLVLLGIGLGMVIVCRSSRRRDRARPEQYEEGNLAAHED